MRESELLPIARCREVLDAVAAEAARHGVSDVEVLIAAEASALTRFAVNAIHQNVAERSGYVSIRTLENQRTARAGTNRLDPDSLRATVAEAIAIMRAQPADDHLLPLFEPATVEPVDRWHSATASCTPQQRAAAVRDAIAIAEAQGQTAAGIFSSGESAEAILNTRGVLAYHTETMARFSITAMAGDSSGWAKQSAPLIDQIDVHRLASSASRKASASARPRVLEPGRYTVILEPAAVLDLVGQIFPDFSGTAIEDKRSFLTDRLGQKLFADSIRISDDAWHPLQAGAPFDGEGVPRRRLRLVEGGVAQDVAWGRPAAHRQGVQPTGHGFPVPNETGEMPGNIVIAGGSTPLEEMIASTDRGILVTRLWYIREVDPYIKLMTGMTRDGTFLVENGAIVSGVRNFRFNQSVIELLANVEVLGPAVRAAGEETFDMVVPPMKVNGFQFSEVTKF